MPQQQFFSSPLALPYFRMSTRAYRRGAAREPLTHEQRRGAVGIKYRHTEVFLDEISAAHKPIDQVMAKASELVTNLRTLLQMLIEKAASTADVALRRRLRGATSVRELGRELVPSLDASSTLCPARARARVAPAPSTQDPARFRNTLISPKLGVLAGRRSWMAGKSTPDRGPHRSEESTRNGIPLAGSPSDCCGKADGDVDKAGCRPHIAYVRERRPSFEPGGFVPFRVIHDSLSGL